MVIAITRSARQGPLISILIVNYRSYEEIGSCLESLGRFLADDVEVIVVDHESDRIAAADLARMFPHVQFIAVDHNPGFAAGVNRGALGAKGAYLLLLNPDCRVESDVPHTLAEWMEAHPWVGVSGAQVRETDGSVQPSARRFPDATTGLAGRTSWLSRVWPTNRLTVRNLTTPVGEGTVELGINELGITEPGFTRAGFAELISTVDWVSGACMMVRRAAFDEVGGMDDGFFLYWEDADLCRRLKQKGWVTVYNAAASVTHLTSRSSAQAPVRSLVAFHQSAFRYYFKHSSKGARLAAPIVYLALMARLVFTLASLTVTRLISPRYSPRPDRHRRQN
jgi:hypothetical protein